MTTNEYTELTDTALEEAIGAADRDLRAACEESDRVTGAARAELTAAKAQGRPAATLQALEARAAELSRVHVNHVAKKVAAVHALQGERARRREAQAAAQEAALKEDLRRRFLAAGGTDAEFVAKYPGLRDAEITRRTLSPDQPDPDAARRAQAWKTRL